MLQAIRDKVTGWIAYGIIFLISIPFALWGVNSYLGGGEAPPAATVDGEEITLQQLDQAYANYRQRLAQLFGGSIPESLANETAIRAQVLDQLIEDTALRRYIEQRHYRIGDKTLARMIRDMDEFKGEDGFSTQIYEAQVRSIGLSPLAFEQQLRLSGSINQFQNGLRSTAFVTPEQSRRYASLKNQTRKIRTLVYRVDPASVAVEPSEIEQYYLANTDRYRTPEQIRVDYIEVSLDNIKQNIAVDEAEVRARYQDHLQSYTTPESREVSHILIKVDDETDEAAARARITEIRERIEAGESFAELAAELSEDPGSAPDGGSLGEVGRGEMVPAFENAMFSLQAGELSEPVRSQFGWHLILVQSISGGETQPFDAVRAALEDEIKTEIAEVQIYELVESMANIVYEQPDSLLPAAEQHGFSVRTSDWFDRASGAGIAADEKLRQIAFSDEILEQGLNSEAIELGDRVVFVRLNERKPAQPQPLEQVEQQVRAELQRQKRADLGRKAGTEALQALRSGETLEDIAQQWSSNIDDRGFVGRDASGVDPAILQRSFSMQKPEQGKVFDGLAVGDGSYAIIELSAVVSADAELDAETEQSLRMAEGEAEFQSALNYLSGRAEVVKTPLDEIEL
jgi:peptidyl-prolyl cis-trans isomerase D